MIEQIVASLMPIEEGMKKNMCIVIREYRKDDVKEAISIWNEVVEDGIAFPQEEFLTKESGYEFFQGQPYTGVAYDEENGRIVGLYILHPNNIGRCGHLCNTSYAVKREMRGKHIGEQLVVHSIRQAKVEGFQILQFNAVVKSNTAALRLYQKLGFIQLGVIPNGFLMKDGSYEDIIPHYYVL